MLSIAEPPLTPELLRARYERVLARLRIAAVAAGRDPDGFQVIAVTKGFQVAVVQAARAAGMQRFGENRVQEALPKVAAVPDAEWHLVGRLQANKVRPAMRAFAVIHSIDSVQLLLRADRIAAEEALAPHCLLEVNLTGEAGRAGFAAADITSDASGGGPLAAALAGLLAMRVDGLMGIAAPGMPPLEARAAFAGLRELRDRLAESIGRPLPELSMGMSGDAESAVAEGASLVRIGTAIFGPRPA